MVSPLLITGMVNLFQEIRISPKKYSDAAQRQIYLMKEGITMALIKNLKIDVKSLGRQKWLVDVIPVAEFVGGQRTDKVVGYRYVVALPAHGFEKLGIKIAGDQLLKIPDGEEYIPVEFEGLDIRIYESSGHAQLSATATGIHVVKEQRPPGNSGQ